VYSIYLKKRRNLDKNVFNRRGPGAATLKQYRKFIFTSFLSKGMFFSSKSYFIACQFVRYPEFLQYVVKKFSYVLNRTSEEVLLNCEGHTQLLQIFV
jgi:hypothetical protein